MSSTPHSPLGTASTLSSPGENPQNGVPSLGQHSTSALILVHDPDLEENDHGLSEDDYDDELGNGGFTSPSSMELSLSPSVIFGYFLSPCLKLGAMLVLSSQASLKLSLPAVLLFSLLSAFSRQIWFLLARYTRKSEIGDMLTEALFPRHGFDRSKRFVKAGSRLLSNIQRLLLSIVYMKGAKIALGTLWTIDVSFIPPSLSLSLIFMVILVPLSLGSSLASKRLIYSTGLANVLYIIWLGGIVYAHARGLLNTDTVMVARGVLTQDITSVAFAFASLSTLQLYSGLVGMYTNSYKKEKRYLSISSVSFYASLVATGLVLPLLFPSVKSHGDHEQTEDSVVFQAFIGTITALILLLGIPPLISDAQPLSTPSGLKRATPRPLGIYILLFLLFFLSLLPSHYEPFLEDTAVFLVLLSTYFLPAFLHIVFHNVRRPLSILIPSQPQPLLRSNSDSSASDEDDEQQLLQQQREEFGPDAHTEELLRRKERALQRRRFVRRVAWDVAVWILLLPIGGGGIVWSVGKLVNAW